MSLPGWNGTVVARPSEWRYCRWDPRCRTSTNPRRSRIPATSRGSRTGTSPTLRDLDGLRSDELTFELRLAVLEEHRDHLFEFLSQLVDIGALRVCARPPWNV